MNSKPALVAMPRSKRRQRAIETRNATRPAVDALEMRRLLTGLEQFGGIAYLPNAAGTQLERYDVTGEKWLAPVSLEGSPGGMTASHVDADGIFAAYGTSIIRYDLDGTDATPLTTTSYPVREIHADGNLLFANQSLEQIHLTRSAADAASLPWPRDGLLD